MPCTLVKPLPKTSARTADRFFHWYHCPFGKLLLSGSDSALSSIVFPNQQPAPADLWQQNASVFAETCKQLDLYFAGKLKVFELSLAPVGTEFQLSVWRELLNIPYGRTTSYGAIANKIGNTKAVRAVGGANGRNPIPIIIPCHRVIGSDGSLTGFGGGLPTKTFLLNLENSEQLALPI